MKIAILGATGFVGSILLKNAIGKGYQVKALVRNPEKLGPFKNKVEFTQGDIFQTDKVNECLVGAEVVFSTIPPERNTKDPAKYAKGMESLVGALEGNGIKRFIHIGGAVHGGGENENWTIGRHILRIFLNLIWKPGLIAKQLEWEVLKKSKLEWTLIRPPQIKKGKSGRNVIADELNLASTVIYVEDLVEFMLEQIASKQWLQKAPLVASAKR